MKPSPSRIFIPSTWPRLSTALLLALTGSSNAGDLLRGGAGYTAPARTAAGGNEAGSVQAAAARANAQDALARTSQVLASVKALQQSARDLAAQQNNAGPNLPTVPNGLGTGGLKPVAGATAGSALWSGANLPVQTTNTGANARFTEKVTVKQTAQQALLTWDTFNVGRQTELVFDQSAGGANRNQWIAFNTVNDPGGVPSQILGSIKADGQVYVINQNGIIFGGESQVNTHTLVASSLPINNNLVERGLLNNPDSQFLFSALPQPQGTKGTPAFTPPPNHAPGGRIGDITVQAGAQIVSPTSAEKVGGRVALIGPNVTNAGTIETPDGQTILAAGLQVAMVEHDSADPTLRGLDVRVGAVVDPASVIPAYAGTALNSGLVTAPHASVTITGKDVVNTGAIDSNTSVSLNGRIDLNASYGLVSENGEEPLTPGPLYQNTGTVTLGSGSMARILPEQSTTEKVVGTKLALNSTMNITGLTVHMEENSTLLAPGANVAINAGIWRHFPETGALRSNFVFNDGQIYLSQGALIDVSGSKNVEVPVSQNYVKAELRAAELADSPLLRESALRGQTVIVDIRNTGTYNGRTWVGSPIADVSGYAGLIERTARELTVAGGTVNLKAGGSVVVQDGATIDVSNGWINFTGAMVQTTRVLSGGHVYDIAQATPDRIYDGVFTGNGTVAHQKWNLPQAFPGGVNPNGQRFDEGGLFGGAGGNLAITAPGMVLDGTLDGTTVSGPAQRSQPPAASRLALGFQRDEIAEPHFAESPTPPHVTFQDGTLPAAAPFGLDASGKPLPLAEERLSQVNLSPSLFSEGGFDSLSVINGDGDITVPSGVTLAAGALGNITLTGANLNIAGSITATGGTINLTAGTISPYKAPALAAGIDRPPPAPERGTINVAPGALISTAGQVVDDRTNAVDIPGIPAVLNAGTININGYRTLLSAGSELNVSGGVLVGATGRFTYGTGGAISIKGGQDPGFASVNGGTLNLGATMTGYSGGRGGTLAVTAPAFQVGGDTAPDGVLRLDPSFFSQGGFTAYSMTGIGLRAGNGQFIPGVFITPGTQINATAENWLAQTNGVLGDLQLSRILQQEGIRTPVNLAFDAPGLNNSFGTSNEQLVRGQFVMGSGAAIRSDARASVSLSGQTAEVLGSVYAPGGSISLRGSNTSSAPFPGASQALTTLRVGAESILSTAGTTILTPDPRGNRTGSVLNGGTVSISGNIATEKGALIDVSGTTGELDVAPEAIFRNGVDNASLQGSKVVRTRIDSNGGTITLSGGQQLYADATLRGAAGGPGTLGGTLNVSSGVFEAANVIAPTLQVIQSGQTIPTGSVSILESVKGADGTPLPGMGYFAADRFNESGLSALTLSGHVLFKGPVSLTAARSLSVATSGVIRADDAVVLTAPAVAVGQRFVAPMLPTDLINYSPFREGNNKFYFPPVTGSGSLTVNAKLIDIGNLSLLGIGSAHFNADNGDIRGSGTFNIAGNVTLRAGQVFPPTASTFNIAAYDYQSGGSTLPGTVTVTGSGTRSLPWSAGGTLNIYASVIEHGGILRAPLGTINLGWDGTGAAPTDAITNLPVPVTKQLTLLSGSLTSVSSFDPVSGTHILLPYGINPGANAWIDPSGTDITRTGPPSKGINLAGENVNAQSGSTLDIRGGGDLYAYRWVLGNGGSRDVLSSSTAFAVIPSYGAEYAPYAAFHTSAPNLKGDPGYVNSSLQPGDRIYLEAVPGVPAKGDKPAIPGLPAGYYTLLPAHYALLPGAFLVTPKTGTPAGTVVQPDNSSIVAGYRFNQASPGGQNVLLSNFEVAASAVVRTRSQYEDYKAGAFFTDVANKAETAVPRLPSDAGRLLLTAAQQIAFGGTLAASAATGARGGMVDISSPLDILIDGPNAPSTPGTLTLNSADLSAFKAQSLLIGGFRQTGPEGTQVTVTTDSITVDNAGSPLAGDDIILASSGSLTLAPDAEIAQSGNSKAESLIFGQTSSAGGGNGALLRLSGDPSAVIVRNGITGAQDASLGIGAGVKLSGGSLTLDSTAGTTLDPAAALLSNAININSGRISLALENAGTLQPNSGLVLSGDALQSLQNASGLSFLSYSSIDIYGTGQVGRSTTKNLALHAAEIRGFNNAGGTATFTAENILIDNSANGTSAGAVTAPQGTLAFEGAAIRIGVKDVRVDQFDHLRMTATGGISGQGAGSLASGGTLTLTAPVLTGSARSDLTIRSSGALEIHAPAGGSSAPAVAPGLGARLSLIGSSVSNDADVLLPSGELTLHATAGDVTAGGHLDTSGTARTFYDLTKYTDGGAINLISDTGSVTVPSGGHVNVAAPAAGGNAGSLTINAPAGSVDIAGTLAGAAGVGGSSGSASITSGNLPSLAALDALLNAAHFNETRSYRAVNGDVLVDGSGTAHHYSVAADNGSVTVTGTIDASGVEGGNISLQAHGGVTLASSARLNASAQKFSAAGKGGVVLIEAGTQRNGTIDTGAVLDIQSGSAIDLSVAARDANSAAAGKFSGTLHLRAPQTTSGTDLQMNALNGTVTGASSIVVEGYRLFDLTDSGGTINTSVQNGVKENGTAFGNATDAMKTRLLSGNAALQGLTFFQPGAEIINRTGDLTLASTWDLSTFRFSPDNVPGVLTMRAAGNLNFNFASSLSDGFGGGSGPLWQQPLLAVGTRSWSYRLAAGADMSAADYRAVQSLDALQQDKGSLILGSNAPGSAPLPVSGTSNTVRDGIINPRYQTIRTGTGDITITAGRDVQIFNPLGTIYTAGTKAADMDNFDIPNVSYTQTGASNLGAPQATAATFHTPQYSLNGGDVTIQAQNNIARYKPSQEGLVADSTRQMPTNWLYRRSYVDPATGQFASTRPNLDTGSTSWWIDFSNFFQGVGALGGGNVTMIAGQDIADVDAVIPTNARMPKGTPNAGALLELGGGDLVVRAGRDIDGGVYYVERGTGTLAAGGSIKTNSTRAAMTQTSIAELEIRGQTPDPTSWLPTTLFAGKSTFDVSARGGILLGQVANPFLLPQGINNSYHQKTYFSTYSQTAGVTVSSLGGDVTLQSNTSGDNPGSLSAWYNNVLEFDAFGDSWAVAQPWLRLAETDVRPFTIAASLMPGTLKATAFSGDINVVGSLTLSPAASGTIDLAASGAIDGLQPHSLESIPKDPRYQWGASTINLSDTDPNALPGITAPVNLPGFSTGTAWRTTLATVLSTSFDPRFLESGSSTGSYYGILQTKQALHASGLLHLNDATPVRLYAGSGGISGITLFSGKAGRIFAGADITDVSLYLQHVRQSDLSIVSSGRDIVAYDPNSVLRTQAQSAGNMLINTPVGFPSAGDIQISGPGTVQVLAGRNLDLGVGPTNPDRTALGLLTIGNARNPALPFEGASIVAAAGLGGAQGFSNPNVDFAAFIAKYVTAPTEYSIPSGTDAPPTVVETHYYLTETLLGKKHADFIKLPAEEQQQLAQQAVEQFNTLSPEKQKLVAIEIFYLVLRDTGRARSKTGVYTVGETAIATLFNGDAWSGDIALTSRLIKTQSGGSINILAPGGGLTVGLDATGNQALDQGILTESGGTINIFTDQSVAVGTSRIFTLRGGDEMIWSSEGDIAAGASSKTVQSAPPTRVLIDPQSGDVKTDLAGLATGGGIGVLATVAGVAAGNVDLIAPKGTIDAGDAGIRVTGNINIAANSVANSANIAAGGSSTGTPAAPGGAATTSTPPPTQPQQQQQAPVQKEPVKAPTESVREILSVITVEVLGYGGGGGEGVEEDKDKERRKKQQEEEAKKAEEADKKAGDGKPPGQ
ncbi:MAG TPA: filamentous hemagglutinin family protein [Verrucomicrobiales bacterium]|nr:filamentous hemagglutinin family protein [Verrucomicrobiales bacterium]